MNGKVRAASWKNLTDFKNHGSTISEHSSECGANSRPFCGPLYRCSLTLRDGTQIPCAALQSKKIIVQLAKRHIEEETTSLGKLGGLDSPHQALAAFVVYGNNINDYDVLLASSSKYAPPVSLMKQIHGETCMGWTGWVFEMKDGKCFSYGTSFVMEFFNLPEGYSFDDVAEVHNHSYVSADGFLHKLRQGHGPPDEYRQIQIYRERPFFTCYIDDI